MTAEIRATVSNIPPELRSSDLRGFFSDWVESSRFNCFHYQHRREQQLALVNAEEDPKVEKPAKPDDHTKQAAPHGGAAGPSDPSNRRVCVIALKTRKDLKELVAKYHDRRWTKTNKQGSEVELPTFCSVRETTVEDLVTKIVEQEQEEPEEKTYLTNKAKKAMSRRKPPPAAVGFSIPDLSPPPGLPQGNVGTPTKRLKSLVQSCVVPHSALKGLGLSLSNAVRNRRHGEFSFSWAERMDGHADHEEEEEWDRHEALHGEVPEHGWERGDRLEAEAHLYEEKVEQTWEKGSSGLVFHTDDAYWDAQRGDFHEITYDELDVEPGSGGPISDLEASTKRLPFVPRQFEKLAGPQGNGKRKKTLEYGEDMNDGKIGKRIDAFERDVRRGLAGRLLEGMGWSDGQGLGPSGEQGKAKELAVTMWKATQKEKQSKAEQRRGIGFKGTLIHSEPDSPPSEPVQAGVHKGPRFAPDYIRIGSAMDSARSVAAPITSAEPYGPGQFALSSEQGDDTNDWMGRRPDSEDELHDEGTASVVVCLSEPPGEFKTSETAEARLMKQNQLEKGIFRRGEVLGPSGSGKHSQQISSK